MKLYTYAEQEPVVQHHTFIQNTAGTSPKQHFIEMLQDVQIRTNRDELFKLLSQIKKANETHTALVNQIDKLTEHYDTLNALQIELALRNISSYLGMS
jgi:DNA invertase Pin-like site-specific DNA recombinase